MADETLQQQSADSNLHQPEEIVSKKNLTTYKVIIGIMVILFIISIGIFWLIIQSQKTQTTDQSLTLLTPDINATPTIWIPPTLTLKLTPLQGSCPDGLSYFENADFSICYPFLTGSFEPQQVQFSTVNGKANNVVSFGYSQDGYFSIMPYDEHFIDNQREYGMNPCYGENCPEDNFNQKETVTIAGFSAMKITNPTQGIGIWIDCGGNYPILIKINEGRYLNHQQQLQMLQTLKIKFR